MQGFNKYHPPDYDPAKHPTLNSYHNKHALGDRARKINQGILIVRFELPFNIWCGGCQAHIGAGVRYNAEKKTVGKYLSTPIYGFRCKCHLCDHWFEIRTDPQNAQYVVHDGARKKDEDWDPEQNGGYAIQDTEKPSTAAPDAFSQLEKTTTQLSTTQQREQRLFELYSLSSQMTSDPYTLSAKLRSTFRADKRVRLGKQAQDDAVRSKYGLADRVRLTIEQGGSIDQDTSQVEGMDAWKAGRDEIQKREVERGRDKAKRISSQDTQSGVERLKKVVVGNTKRRFDPFHRPGSTSSLSSVSSSNSSLDGYTFKTGSSSSSSLRSKGRSIKLPPPKRSTSTSVSIPVSAPDQKSGGLALIEEYQSD
ncbi:C2C2-type Zn-finger protein [Phaffia rhodozyma]|uniref:C2C2-type Zn-finger protein n=1 Tax=Phaffia rhodozyma TaxID=264483 RepID=A0A0F7SYU9_PHARH|nr:C2C2-type Zn-finger protein [Phaffia rhodozyma]